MPEKCQPNIFYHIIRPFLPGWVNSAAHPYGLLYEGISNVLKMKKQINDFIDLKEFTLMMWMSVGELG